MTRDERLLAALATGEASTVELVGLTGIPERTCRAGLRRLITAGLVWSPERGLWRLTSRGVRLAEESPAMSANEGPSGPASPKADRPLDVTL